MLQDYSHLLANFVDNLNELMLEEKLTAELLGQKLGVSHTTIYRWLAQKELISTNNLIKLSKSFGYSADYLLGLTYKKEFVSSIKN